MLESRNIPVFAPSIMAMAEDAAIIASSVQLKYRSIPRVRIIRISARQFHRLLSPHEHPYRMNSHQRASHRSMVMVAGTFRAHAIPNRHMLSYVPDSEDPHEACQRQGRYHKARSIILHNRPRWRYSFLGRGALRLLMYARNDSLPVNKHRIYFIK